MTDLNWLLVVAYLIGIAGTFFFNLSITVGPITYPLSMVRNALLWPIYLPILIIMSRG